MMNAAAPAAAASRDRGGPFPGKETMRKLILVAALGGLLLGLTACTGGG